MRVVVSSESIRSSIGEQNADILGLCMRKPVISSKNLKITVATNKFSSSTASASVSAGMSVCKHSR